MKHQNARWSEKVKYKQTMWKQIAKVLIAVLWRYAFFLRSAFISQSLSFAFSNSGYEKKYIHTHKDKSKQSAYLCFALKIENKMQTRVRSSQIKYRFKARTVNTMVAQSMRLLESRRQLYKLYQCKGSHYVYMNYLWYLNTIFNSTKTWAGARKRETKIVKLVLML